MYGTGARIFEFQTQLELAIAACSCIRTLFLLPSRPPRHFPTAFRRVFGEMEDDAELLDWGGEEDDHTGEFFRC